MKKLELTEDELNELIAKVANEIADYGDQFSEDIYNVFIKLLKLNPTRKTTLVEAMENVFSTKNNK